MAHHQAVAGFYVILTLALLLAGGALATALLRRLDTCLQALQDQMRNESERHREALQALLPLLQDRVGGEPVRIAERRMDLSERELDLRQRLADQEAELRRAEQQAAAEQRARRQAAFAQSARFVDPES